MAEAPKPTDEKIVFSSEDFGQSTTIGPVKEAVTKPPEPIIKKEEENTSWLENRKNALMIGIIGGVIIIVIFGLLFATTIDWQLILNPPP